MDMQEYDVILGMDWLAQHSAMIDYAKKGVLVECLVQGLCLVQGVRSGEPKQVISAIKAYCSPAKDCVGYLASVVVSSSPTLRVQDVPVV